MDGAVIVKVVIMALILVLVIVTIFTCNKFMVLKTRAENQASQIDIQLARRADLIPNLVEIVKGYAKHEKETLMTVVELRNRMTLADTRNERFEANEALNRASRKVFAVAEQYPELKANTNFLQLQTELSETEDRVSKARQFYNDAATKYNIELQMFPKSILAKIFHLSKLSLLEFGKMENPGIHF